MRSKRTHESPSVATGKSAPNGSEVRDKAAFLRGEDTLGRNGESAVRGDKDTQTVRLTEDIPELKHAGRGIKIVPTVVLAGLGALAVLLVLGALELVLERVLGDVVALSIPVVFGSITAAGITYFALRRQEAFYRRTFDERERAENARREAERKYRDIFENAVEGIFQTSPDGRIYYRQPGIGQHAGFCIT